MKAEKIEFSPSDQAIYRAWERSSSNAQRYHEALVRCLAILDMESDRRDLEGRDELGLRAFTRRIRAELSE